MAQVNIDVNSLLVLAKELYPHAEEEGLDETRAQAAVREACELISAAFAALGPLGERLNAEARAREPRIVRPAPAPIKLPRQPS